MRSNLYQAEDNSTLSQLGFVVAPSTRFFSGSSEIATRLYNKINNGVFTLSGVFSGSLRCVWVCQVKDDEDRAKFYSGQQIVEII